MYEYEPQQNPKVNENPYKDFISFGYTPETFKERQNIRKVSNIIGFALIIQAVIVFFWADLYYLIAEKIGISALRAYEIVSEPAVLQLVQILLSIMVFTLPFILLVKMNGLRVDELVPIKKVKKEYILPFFFMGLGFCAFANISTSIASSIFEGFGISYDVDFGQVPSGFFGFILTVIATAVVPAFVEEFACRGIMLSLLRKFGDTFAIIVSSILFGILHGNFEQMPFAFLVGLILGFITVKTDSLVIPIMVHGANNFVSVLLDYWNAAAEIQNTTYIIYLVVCMLLAVVGVCICTKKGLLNFEKSGTNASEKQKYKWFLTSPVIIVFIVFNILDAFSYFIV